MAGDNAFEGGRWTKGCGFDLLLKSSTRVGSHLFDLHAITARAHGAGVISIILRRLMPRDFRASSTRFPFCFIVVTVSDRSRRHSDSW